MADPKRKAGAQQAQQDTRGRKSPQPESGGKKAKTAKENDPAERLAKSQKRPGSEPDFDRWDN